MATTMVKRWQPPVLRQHRIKRGRPLTNNRTQRYQKTPLSFYLTLTKKTSNSKLFFTWQWPQSGPEVRVCHSQKDPSEECDVGDKFAYQLHTAMTNNYPHSAKETLFLMDPQSGHEWPVTQGKDAKSLTSCVPRDSEWEASASNLQEKGEGQKTETDLTTQHTHYTINFTQQNTLFVLTVCFFFPILSFFN